MLCAMATVALNGAKTYYEEKHDKATFVKNIISDNILLGDIYVRAKELHFVSEAPRAVFLIRQVETSDPALIDVVHTLFPDKQVDFVLSISETDVALIKQLSEGAEPRELYKIAKQIEEKITEELHVRVVIGIGTIVGHIRELAPGLQGGGDRHRRGPGVRHGEEHHQLRESGYRPADLPVAHHPVRDVPSRGV